MSKQVMVPPPPERETAFHPSRGSFSPPPAVETSRFGLGHLQDPPDPRDWNAGAKLGAPRNLPKECLGLEGHVRRVLNQGMTSRCVGCATGSGIDVRLRRLGIVAPEPSSLGIYTLARGYDSEKSEPLIDSGCYPRMAMRAVRESGVPTEESWPSDDARTVNLAVPWDVHQKASAAKLRAWRRIDTMGDGRLDEIALALVNGYPVPYGRAVGRAFEDYNGKGAVEATPPGQSLGGHDTLILGYTTDGLERIWRCLNSWGSWGDKGFYWARSSSLTDASASDFYLIEVDGPDVGKD